MPCHNIKRSKSINKLNICPNLQSFRYIQPTCSLRTQNPKQTCLNWNEVTLKRSFNCWSWSKDFFWFNSASTLPMDSIKKSIWERLPSNEVGTIAIDSDRLWLVPTPQLLVRCLDSNLPTSCVQPGVSIWILWRFGSSHAKRICKMRSTSFSVGDAGIQASCATDPPNTSKRITSLVHSLRKRSLSSTGRSVHDRRPRLLLAAFTTGEMDNTHKSCLPDTSLMVTPTYWWPARFQIQHMPDSGKSYSPCFLRLWPVLGNGGSSSSIPAEQKQTSIYQWIFEFVYLD